MFAALIASIGYAGGVVVDKLVLSVFRVSVKRFVSLLFIFLAAITVLFLPWFGSIEPSFWHVNTLLIFLLMIVVAVAWNIYYYRGIQKENLHEFELIMLLSPLVTIILAEIFLPEERNLKTFIIALAASGAFMASRLRGHHLKLTLGAKETVAAMLLLSFESILVKYLLTSISPVSLYFVRTLIIAFVFQYLYKPSYKELTKNSIYLVALSALFGVMQMVLKFYGFKNLGVVETTMILLLGPFLVYGFSYFYFNERRYFKRDLACAGVVILCIIYSTLRN